MTHSRPTSPAADLVGENSLLAQIERSHALLTLLTLIDPDRLSDVGIGFDLVTQEVLATLESAERYLHKEKRIVEMFCDATRERP